MPKPKDDNTDDENEDDATEDNDSEREPVDLQPRKGKKKGEPSDNLRKRSEWFQKRTRGD